MKLLVTRKRRVTILLVFILLYLLTYEYFYCLFSTFVFLYCFFMLLSSYIDVCVCVCRCAWGNDYSHRKWTWWTRSKSWTRLFVFHLELISLGNVWIQLFSLQLLVNNRADWAFELLYGHQSTKRKTLNSNLLKCLKIDLESHPARAEGLIDR